MTLNTKRTSTYNLLLSNNVNHVSTGVPTYWLSDSFKIPDLDFCLTEGLLSSQQQLSPA